MVTIAKPQELIAKLREVEMLLSQVESVAKAVRSIGVTEELRRKNGGPPGQSGQALQGHGNLGSLHG